LYRDHTAVLLARTSESLWGRMASCGRLAIGLAGFVPSDKPITNRLQVANLPHGEGS
jgi:hypothetical protein